MSYPPQSPERIAEMRQVYLETQSIKLTGERLDYNVRTITKYVSDLMPKRIPASKIVEAYALTGKLKDAAYVCKLSKTQVWRILKKENIVVGKGAKDWKRLYATLRKRVSESKWRHDILARDKYQCQKCGIESKTVHHLKKLSKIRNDVLRANPGLNPFRSYEELRKFTDLVMTAHDSCEGITLCSGCHNSIHFSHRRIF